MAIYGFPLDAVDNAPSYTGKMLRQALSALVGGGSSARPLAGGSGVSPRTPTNTVTASATTWTVKAHAGYIDAQADGEQSGYFYAVDSSGDGLPTGAMAAANSTNPRIDLLSVRVDDPAAGDGSVLPAVEAVYTTGTASASPAVPPAPARSMVLAQIAVPKFGGGNPVVTWVAPNMNAAVAPAIVASTPAFTASGAAALAAPQLFSYHNIVALNQFGQVAIETPFKNGVVTAKISTGDITAWNGLGGPYDYDNAGTGGACRAFFRCQDAAGAWLGTSNVRAHFNIVGW